MTDSASYLSAVSIMLGAYGFFYGNYREVIHTGLEVGERSDNDNIREQQSRDVGAALSVTHSLGFVAAVVWLIFLGPVIEEVEAAFAVSLSLHHYSAIDVAFVLAATAWLGIAIIVWHQAWKLRSKRDELK